MFAYWYGYSFLFIFFFVIPVESRFPCGFHVHICFFAHFLNCKFNSGMLKMPDRKSIISQARQNAANVVKVCEEEPKLMHYLYRERVSKLTGTSTTTLPRGYKIVFMLNSAEHEISNAHRYKIGIINRNFRYK